MDLFTNGPSRKVRAQKKTLSTSPVNTASCLITVLSIGCSCQSTILWDLSFPASNYRPQCLSAAHTPKGSHSHQLLNIKVTVQCDRILQNRFDNLFCHLVNHVCLWDQHMTFKSQEEGFYFRPSRWEMPNSEVTFWSTRQQEVSKLLPVWGDNTSHSSKKVSCLRGIGVVNQHGQQRTVSASPFSFELKPKSLSHADRQG